MGVQSRYRFCTQYADAAGRRFLDEREPFRYRAEPDNIYHVVVEGDTWGSIAYRYLGSLANPELLWWLLCEYQPQPVVDPTLRLEPGTTVIVPSARVVRTLVFAAENRRYH